MQVNLAKRTDERFRVLEVKLDALLDLQQKKAN